MAGSSPKLPSPARVLVFVRHAHRSKELGGVDNGLSKKGRRQAQLLAEHFRKVRPEGDVQFFSSPKRRCVETLEPMAQVMKKRIRVLAELDEQGPKETNRQFLDRVKRFCTSWREEGHSYSVVCSHGDWIPEALESLTGARVDLSKGGWAEIRMAEGEAPKLHWLIQSFGDG